MSLYPLNKNDVDDVYLNNESQNGGFFPVGLNNLWHGGIHLESLFEPIYPVYAGEIIAYRINNDFEEIEYFEKYSEKEFKSLKDDLLSDNTESLFIDLEKLKIDDKTTFKSAFKTDKELVEKVDIVVYKKEGSDVKRKISNNFFLIKHIIPLPTGNPDNKKDMVFYSLYIHLLPEKYYNYEGDYNNKIVKNKTSFYRDWAFKISKEIDKKYIKTKNEKKLFEGSSVDINDDLLFLKNVKLGESRFKEKDIFLKVIAKTNPDDEKTYEDFINYKNVTSSSGTDIKLWLLSFKGEKKDQILYLKKKKDVTELTFYSFNKNINNDNMKDYKIGTNKSGWWLIYSNENYKVVDTKSWEYINNYIIVDVPHPEDTIKEMKVGYIEESDILLEGTNYKVKKDLTLFELEENSLINTENYIMPDSLMSFAYKIMEVTDKSFEKSIGCKYVLVLLDLSIPRKNCSFNTPALYGFISLFGKNILPIIYPKDGQKSYLKELLKVPKDIKFYKKVPKNKLISDDFVKINSKSKVVINKSPYFSYKYVEYIVPAKVKAYINANDVEIVSSLTAKLKYNDNYLSESKGGLLLYDSPNDSARKILSVDTEIRLANPDAIVYDKKPGTYLVTKIGDKKCRKYINIKDCSEIKWKNVFKDDFKADSSIKTDKKIKITGNDVLGYAGFFENYKNSYHLETFFKDASFLDNSDVKIYYYNLPVGLNKFKKIKSIKYDNYYLSTGSELEIIETTDNYYKIKIKIAIIYVYKDFIDREDSDDKLIKYKIKDKKKDEKKQTETDFKIPAIILNYAKLDFTSTKDDIYSFTKKELFENGDKLSGISIKGDAPGENGYARLFFDLEKNNINIEGFIKKKSGEHKVDKDNNKIITYGNGKDAKGKSITLLSIYKQNPDTEIEFEDDPFILESNKEIPDQETGIIEDIKGNKFKRFTIGEKRIKYLEHEEAENNKINYFEWKNEKFFTVKDSDPNNDCFCDVDEILDLFDDNKNLVVDGRKVKSDGTIELDELLKVFNERDTKSSIIIRQKLRKLICKHPLEWDKNLYDNIEDELKKRSIETEDGKRTKILQDTMGKLDLWSSISGKEDFGSSNKDFWFIHPVSFLEHMYKLKIMEVNPYKDKPVSADITQVDKSIIHYEEIVKDSPGFAPYFQTATDYDNYSPPTGLFDNNYTFYNDPTVYKEYHHDGVDFAAGDERTPVIKSMINGTVVATCIIGNNIDGYQNGGKGYGNVLIIKNDNEDLIYMLCHLSEYLVQEGDKVNPGMNVARVGNTGNSHGAHLHLTVFKSDKNKKADILGEYDGGIIIKEVVKSNKINPFNHSKSLTPNVTWK